MQRIKALINITYTSRTCRYNREGEDIPEKEKQPTSALSASALQRAGRGGLLCHFLCSFAWLKLRMITNENSRLEENNQSHHFGVRRLEIEGRLL